MDVPIVIDAPLQRVWTVLIDTTQWPVWGPSLKRVESDERFIRAGSQGRVQTALGMWLPYTVTEFKPEQRWSWEVSGVPATGHRVEALQDGRTRLVFEVPLMGAPYASICYLAGKNIAALLAK